jgi:D-alanine-D-alanine ligase
MDPDKYEVVPIGITKQGAWIASGDPMLALRAGVSDDSIPRLTSMLAPDPSGQGRAEIVELAPASSQNGNALSASAGQPLDVIFPVLHGPYGEDGTIQGLLEMAGIPYVGAGVAASAVGMDKDLMKRLFRADGLPVAPYVCVLRDEWHADPDSVRGEVEGKLTYPMFAKPANMGSSVGISKIHGPEEFAQALEEAARYDRKVLIEQGIDAREFECAVLGNERPEASVVGEIVPGNEFYDYRAKYVDDNSELIIPAKLPEHVSTEIQRLAIAAFKAIDGAGMARVDFFVERDLSRVWLNEINTIPGFTRISMYPKLWETSGLTYSALIDRLIELALERYSDRQLNKQALEDVGGDLTV